MATIVATNAQGTGAVTVTETTLDGSSDTFAYSSGGNQYLSLLNGTAGALTPIIDGDGATTVPVSGVGNIDISSGYAVGSIAIGEMVVIRTSTIEKYLAGTIEITGGTGLTAVLLEY